MTRFIAVLAVAILAAAPSTRAMTPQALVCAACVKANLESLAGEALHGRRCGSADEHAAAALLAADLKRYRVRGAFPHGDYLQSAQIMTPAWAAMPTLTLSGQGRTLTLSHGQEMIVASAPPQLSGQVVVVTDPRAAAPELADKIVVWAVGGPPSPAALKAAVVILPAQPRLVERWGDAAARPPGRPEVVGVVTHDVTPPVPTLLVKPEVMAELAAFDGGQGRLAAPRAEPTARSTFNVVGVIHGSAKDADQHAVLLSAHYDHLGVRSGVTFHGADDDASGTTAVLEFARILGSGPRPKRTVYFGLFGCEEEGELGAQYFDSHPPEPLSQFAANLEFEMIGVDDPKNPGALMLTGWERTNLGPALKAHGALIGPDPYPEQHFFQRSDNYQLALRGVVAQTVSAWPLTPTYHSPSDDLAHVDVGFMDQVIGSLVAPVEWLLNSDFQPEWRPGQNPAASR